MSELVTAPPSGGLRPDQEKLTRWFGREAPELADLYRGAVRMVNDRGFPGRLRFVAHAVREIRNRLPDIVCGGKSESVQYANRLDEIAELWKHEGHRLEVAEAGEVAIEVALPPSSGPSLAPLLYMKIQRLLREHSEGRKRPIEKAQALIEALAPENRDRQDALQPVVRHWNELTSWFQKRVHQPVNPGEDIPDDELQGKFRSFEDSLKAMAGAFYESVEGLDEILGEANA